MLSVQDVEKDIDKSNLKVAFKMYKSKLKIHNISIN